MEKKFSVVQREELKEQLQSQYFDLLIIGGGITGAGIALDASARGMKTALIEMQDFAAGTSSRSTKLVHGGLRYLKRLEIKLVAEVGKERAIVYHNAMHVTHPEVMLLPLTKNGSLSKLEANLGLTLYDFLAGVKKDERRQMLSAEDTIKTEPLLRTDVVTGGASYYEYRTDDARLTIELLKKAFEQGATIINYTQATAFLYHKEKVVGVKAKDLTTGAEFELKASTIINACGPWVDNVSELDKTQEQEGKKLHLTKGVHLVVDYSKLPLKHSVYFDVKDGRMIFAIPRNGKTYIGTTDTDYYGDLKEPEITVQDRDYLLYACAAMFPAARLTAADVESGWAGLRPLVKEKGKSASAISRKDELFESPTGLITIAGGKLTGYRKMAQRATDLAALRLKTGSRKFSPCTTEHIKLSGGDLGNDFNAFVKAKTNEGIVAGIPEADAAFLAATHGSNASVLFNFYKETSQNKLLEARLRYAVEHEMAVTLADYFIRRTGDLYFNIKKVKNELDTAASIMERILHWSPEQKQKNIQEVEDKIAKLENLGSI